MAKHPSQGEYKKVLCVCSGGLLRSPTAAWVLSNPPYNFNTRCAGIDDKYALIQVDSLLIEWADEIVCMERKHHKQIEKKFEGHEYLGPKKVICLGLSDDYLYRDESLINVIKERYDEATSHEC